MINNEEFADRLKIIMSHNQLTASAFAERIQVQRSSISHLLSGRNRPSLDFVMRVVKEFDEVELYWLLNGKGTYPSDIKDVPNEKSASAPQAGVTGVSSSSQPERIEIGNRGPDKGEFTASVKEADSESMVGDSKSIERIVVFYKDGTFKSYSKA